jgi:glutamate-1-semialdehyde 2,1-aminomutase
MVAGYATLSELKNSANTTYSKLNKLGDMAREGLSKTFGDKVIVTGKGSLFMTHFANNNSTDAAKCDSAKLQKYHFKMIAQDGIFFLPGKLGAISMAHTNQDIKKLIRASENFKF